MRDVAFERLQEITADAHFSLVGCSLDANGTLKST